MREIDQLGKPQTRQQKWRLANKEKEWAKDAARYQANKQEALARRAARRLAHPEAPEYKCWVAMRQRCLNPSSDSYADYGGRGITICERWEKYTNFLTDMGARPSSKHSLDRIDNDKGYSPENCRWATAQEQNRNQRRNRLITIDGVTKYATEWAEHVGRSCFWNRLHRGLTGADLIKPRRQASPRRRRS